MNGLGRLGAWCLAGGLGFSALLVLLALLNRRNQHAGLGEEIQYDDFAFAVESTKRAAMLGSADSPAKANGTFVVVTLKVVNHAKRVDFRFDRSFAILEDADERRFSVSHEGQAALEASEWKIDPCAAAIPAGASCVTELAFDVPPDARELRLKISMGGNAFLDFLDWAGWGDKWIRID